MTRKNLLKLKLPNFESKQPPKTLKCGRRTFVPFSCVDAKHLFRFRSQSCVLKFIRHSVDEAWRSEVTEVHAELKEVVKKIKQFQGKNS